MNLAKYIDHTILKADATRAEVTQLINEAMEHGFYSVCVNSAFVHFAKNKLVNSDVKIAAVVGFPLGASTSASKVFEAKDAIESGADEIDMVINISWVKDNRLEAVRDEIRDVKQAIGNCVLKVIIETCLLSKVEIATACQLAKEAGADFVKTSTGFSTGGATAEDIALMRKTVGPEMGVKASGGIRNYDTAIKMVEAGANRLGASASVSIITDERNK